jgi:mannan polymerase complexes MNN9 subunit
MSTLEPTVDWVLWLDSDVVDLSPSIFEDLLDFGGTGAGEERERNDVVVANVFTRSSEGRLEIYDQNKFVFSSLLFSALSWG